MIDGYVMGISVQMETISCCKCQALFAVAADTRTQWRDKGTFFWCPCCGNIQHYSDSNVQQLERKLKVEQAARQRERADHDQTRAELRETEARRRGEKGAKTRIMNRVAKGICPCCNRSFTNLRKHMAGQHPGYAKEPTQ